MVLYRLKELQKLVLRKNQLAELSEVVQWESLEMLDLSLNRLQMIHPLLLFGTQLVTLQLAGNRLTELPLLPKCIRELNVSNNALVRLAPNMADLSAIEECDLSGE